MLITSMGVIRKAPYWDCLNYLFPPQSPSIPTLTAGETIHHGAPGRPCPTPCLAIIGRCKCIVVHMESVIAAGRFGGWCIADELLYDLVKAGPLHEAGKDLWAVLRGLQSISSPANSTHYLHHCGDVS